MSKQKKVATLGSDHGSFIEIPDTGNAAALLLEWISDYEHSVRVTIAVQKTLAGELSLTGQVLRVRFAFIPEDCLQEAVDYINNNIG